MLSIWSQGSVGILLTIRNAWNRKLYQVLARLNTFRNTKSQRCSLPQIYSGLVYATPEKFENGGFTLKTNQLFCGHTTLDKFENATITGHFGLVVEENSDREISWLSWRHRFREESVFKMFSVHTKTQSRRFQIPPVWRAFSKSSVLWRVSVGGSPTKL